MTSNFAKQFITPDEMAAAARARSAAEAKIAGRGSQPRNGHGAPLDAADDRPFAPPEEALPPLEIICPTELEGLPIPDRRWLVRDWIPAGAVTGIYGNGGVGKSLIAQQLQTAAAVGLPWLGLPVEPTGSLGVYCEDSKDELHRRQHNIDATYDCQFGDLAGVHWLSRTDDDNLLMTFTSRGVGELTKFHRQLMERALDLRVGLVIFDTVADGFGGNENDRGHVRQFVGRALGSIASAINGAVIACAHPSRTGLNSGEGDGGSTGWSNAFRSRLFLSAPDPQPEEPPDSDARILQRKKANYAARLDQFKLRWRNGVIIPDQPFQAASGTFGRREPNDVFLALVDDFTGSGRPVSASPNASNFAPKAFAAVAPAQRDNYTRADFKRAMESLFALRAIKVDQYGRKSDQRFKIIRAEP